MPALAPVGQPGSVAYDPGSSVVELFRRPPGLPRTCNDTALCEAVLAFSLGCSADKTAALLGVPVTALEFWTTSEEWGDIAHMLRPRLQAWVDSSLTRLQTKAIAILEDRLEFGEKMQAKDDNGEHIRVPLKTSTALSVFTALRDKQTEMQRVIDAKDTTEDDVDVRRLADLLRRFAQAHEIPAEATSAPESAGAPADVINNVIMLDEQ